MSNSYRNRTLRKSVTPRRPASSTLNANRRDASIDWSKGPRDNLKTILSSITKKDDITIQQRTSYLNFFIKFCCKMKVISVQTCGFSFEEIFYCLRVSLFHESADVRAAGLRAMRYLLKNELAVEAFYRTNLQLLVARSLEIELNNFPERVQSLHLIRKLLALKPDSLPEALCRSIIAIARDGCMGPDRDRMRDACMACLGEITLLNPQVSCKSGGISALLDCILMSHESYHISEALIGCILYILNSPELRCQLSVDVDLRQFIAPFTDCHYSMPLVALNTQRRDEEEQREIQIRLNAAKIALVSILRSWPGIIALSKVVNSLSNVSTTSSSSFYTTSHLGNTSRSRSEGGSGGVDEVNGLSSLIEMLNLPYREIRKHIMELIFELFYLTVPKYTSDFQAALDSCSPSSVQDDWHLHTGFVASEGKSLLPHLAKKRLNLLDNYLSLLLYTFLTNGLLDGLVSVITVPTDAENSVRAIILVGELLHLSSQLLPPEIAQRYYTLPKLIETALSPDNTPEQRNVAKASITFLNHIHNRKKHHLIPYSLYLNQLIHFYNPSHRKFHGKRRKSAVSSPLIPSVPVHTASIPAMVMASSSLSAGSQSSSSFSASRKDSKDHANDDIILGVQIRESLVLKSDPNKWDWHLISSILKSSSELFKRLEDSSHRSFVKKVIHYFKPSSKLFSIKRLDDESGYNISTVGCYLIDFLIEADESKTGEYIGDYLNDIGYCISQITGVDTSNSSTSSDAILHSHNLLRTWSHAYFLFVGRFTGTQKGLQCLEKAGICDTILKLVQSSPNENYLKLIISSFNYSKDATFTRNVLSKVLSCEIESARFYAVKYLRVLLRLGSEDYRDLALELLSQRLCDESQAVVIAAIDILDEACDIPENLEALIDLRPSLSHVGDRGLLLLIRYLSSPNGYKFLRNTNFLNNELERWKSYYNLKYVKIVEDLLNEAFSVHQRNENGTYGRRSDKKITKKAVFVPAHLYGELVKQDDGYNLVVQENYLGPICNVIRNASMHDEMSILQLKAALWAIGSVGSSVPGFQLVNETLIIPAIIKLASDAPVLSIRGTCFYVLGMLASTEGGANLLKDYGWYTVRHTRGEKWPLSKEMIGANMEAGLFFYPLTNKREHTWSVSTASTRLTDICAVISGKIKSLDPANSFVFNEDLHNINCKNMEDILSHSFPTLEMSQLFQQKKNLSFKKGLLHSSTYSNDNGRSGDDSRPGSSFDYHLKDFNIITSCTHENAGIWMNDDHMSVKRAESQPGNGDINNGPIASSLEGEADYPGEISHHDQFLIKSVSRLSPNQNLSSYQADTPDAISSDHTSSQEISKISAYLPDDRYHRKISVTSHAGQSRSLTEGHAMPCSYESPNFQLESFFKRSTSHDINFSNPYQTLSLRTYGNSSEISNFDSIPSAMDTLGYATLTSLQRNRIASINPRRHHITDESLSFNDETSDEDSFSLSFKGSRNFSEVQNQDHDECSSDEELCDNITYVGISLPMNLSSFFSEAKDFGYRKRQDSVHQKNQLNSAVENRSKEPADSSSQDQFNFEFHNNLTCLVCSFKDFVSKSSTNSQCPMDPKSVGPAQKTLKDNLLTVEKDEEEKKHVTLLEPALQSYVSSSLESRGGSLPRDSKLIDTTGMRKEVIRYVSYLLGWLEVIKMAEQGLLNLKQKYPLAFQDICLYSEISMQLASYNFRLPARRFLQELFMDLSFDSLYPDVESICKRNSIYDIDPCDYSD